MLQEEIIFQNHVFCITGNFENYTRKQIYDMIIIRGGIPSDKMTLNVHYLIYGSIKSPDFKYDSFGNKYMTAHEYKKNGTGNIIGIFPEDLFLDSLKKNVCNSNKLKIKSNSLKLLNLLICSKSRMKRNEALLRPLNALNYDWEYYVPNCFNDELDIKQTVRICKLKDEDGNFIKDDKGKIKTAPKLVWTQGNSFAFQKGDTFYDTPLAYQQWDEALKHIKKYIQITGVIGTDSMHDYNDTILFTVYKNDNGKIREFDTNSLSQYNFVRFLIEGK